MHILSKEEFIEFAMYIVENEFYDANPDIQGAYDVEVAWDFETEDGYKALFFVPKVQDDIYYEFTYNKEKHEGLFNIFKRRSSMKFDSLDIEYYFNLEGEEEGK